MPSWSEIKKSPVFRIFQATRTLAMLAVANLCVAATAAPAIPALPSESTGLDKLAREPVDIAPWAYVWRADRTVQEKPEAAFIPRRLERMDKVYRTAFYEMPREKLKSIYYDMPDLLKPLPPKPAGRLLTGLLWTGGVAQYRVELVWPSGAEKIPSTEAVEVRVYPTSFGWFGWTVDKILSHPQISKDRLTWTYKSEPGGQMDWAFSGRVDAATEMVAVFIDSNQTRPGQPAVPNVRVICPQLGLWKRIDVEVEWGFQPGMEKSRLEGWVDSYLAIAGPVSPLDEGTKVKEGHRWRSRVAGHSRRGIVVPMLCATGSVPGLDSRLTVWTGSEGFTIRLSELQNGPILIPEQGLFFTRAGSGETARQYAAELAAKDIKNVRRLVREHREAASWEEVMREVRLSTCPPGTVLAPFPAVEDPPMQVELPDAGWTAAWRAASFQMKGKHMWGGLAVEVSRVAHEMNLVGLHEEADKVYQYFLQSPGAKSDGDYSDGEGALEWAKDMRHDMGYSHDGTHASTGSLLFAMADRYFLTGDKEWFEKHRARLTAAADWIIRQRRLYLKDVPNRQDLFVAGLLPPAMLGDYAIPSSDWRWYYCDNAYALQGLQRFADVLTLVDPSAGRKYSEEAAAFRQDLLRAAAKEASLSPVRRLRDGACRRFIPAMAYARGLMCNLEFNAPQRPQTDVLVGSLPLAEPFAALAADDSRITGTLDVMEEVGMSPAITTHVLTVNVMKPLATPLRCTGELEERWFWIGYGASFPKAAHNAYLYLLQDDVPNFLRFWMNSYAALVGADGKLWEWGQLGKYTSCQHPDNGTAGWFIENFRNLLVMEEGRSLWVARATPRVWLEQGKRITVRNAPTYFGKVAYEIVSDADHGKITAVIEMPARDLPERLLVRFRHPHEALIKKVIVDGAPWNRFNPDKEFIELTGRPGKVQVTAVY